MSKEAKQLIEAYWKFLTSNAEIKIQQVVDEISEQQTDLTELDTKVLADDSVLSEWLSENSGANLKIWNAQIKSIEVLRKQLISSLKSKKWNDEITAKQISLRAFPLLEKSIQDKISSFNEAEISRKIKVTEKEIQEIKSKKVNAILSREANTREAFDRYRKQAFKEKGMSASQFVEDMINKREMAFALEKPVDLYNLVMKYKPCKF